MAELVLDQVKVLDQQVSAARFAFKEPLDVLDGAWIGLGPPSFDEAAIDIKAATRVIRVKLRY